MRPTHLALAALLLAGSPLAAQGPTGNPNPATPASPPDPRLLDPLLQQWEQRMKSLKKLGTECVRQEVKGLRGSKATYEGVAYLMKPAMFLVNLTNKEVAEERELYISNGNNFYEYKFKDKRVLVHEIPKNNQGAIADDTFLALLNGMPAEEIKKRYDVKLKKAVPNDWYVYVTIFPKDARDKQEFSEAEMTLYSPDIGKLDPRRIDWALLPARIWFKAPNSDEVTWLFQKPNVNVDL